MVNKDLFMKVALFNIQTAKFLAIYLLNLKFEIKVQEETDNFNTISVSPSKVLSNHTIGA
jgi:hypothetical protein